MLIELPQLPRATKTRGPKELRDFTGHFHLAHHMEPFDSPLGLG
jgi:hypothetical protein